MEGAGETGTRRERVIKQGIAATLAAGLGLAGWLVPWNDLLSSGPPQPHVSPGGSLSWEAEGWVKSATESTSSIRVSSGFLGLSSVTLVVPGNALIMVGGKEGGFDDLHEGRRVRAMYDVRPSGLLAKSIEVLGDEPRSERPLPSAVPPEVSTGSRTTPPIPPETRHATENLAPAPPSADKQTGARPSPLKPAETRSPTGAPAPAPKSAETRSAKEIGPRAIPSAAPLARTGLAREARDESSIPGRAMLAPPNAPNEGPRAANAEPRRGQAADPGAVIDWLLKESPASDR